MNISVGQIIIAILLGLLIFGDVSKIAKSLSRFDLKKKKDIAGRDKKKGT
tara:strand:- start:20876 stop:21025 length:150 start_codon:yes stop_codon:yes gene_type:complete